LLIVDFLKLFLLFLHMASLLFTQIFQAIHYRCYFLYLLSSYLNYLFFKFLLRQIFLIDYLLLTLRRFIFLYLYLMTI
jgi:hypothetical protein